MFEDIDPSFLLYSPFDFLVIPDYEEDEMNPKKRQRHGRKGVPDRGSRDPDPASDSDSLFDEWVDDSLESSRGNRRSIDHTDRYVSQERNDSWESMEEAFSLFVSSGRFFDPEETREKTPTNFLDCPFCGAYTLN